MDMSDGRDTTDASCTVVEAFGLTGRDVVLYRMRIRQGVMAPVRYWPLQTVRKEQSSMVIRYPITLIRWYVRRFFVLRRLRELTRDCR